MANKPGALELVFLEQRYGFVYVGLLAARDDNLSAFFSQTVSN
jgi:hypothetical protein